MTSTTLRQQIQGKSYAPMRAVREGERARRRYGERFPHCTNTGGCCENFDDWSECDRCGFCIMEQLRREKLKLSCCEDGLMRIMIEKKPPRTPQTL